MLLSIWPEDLNRQEVGNNGEWGVYTSTVDARTCVGKSSNCLILDNMVLSPSDSREVASDLRTRAQTVIWRRELDARCLALRRMRS